MDGRKEPFPVEQPQHRLPESFRSSAGPTLSFVIESERIKATTLPRAAGIGSDRCCPCSCCCSASASPHALPYPRLRARELASARQLNFSLPSTNLPYSKWEAAKWYPVNWDDTCTCCLHPNHPLCPRYTTLSIMWCFLRVKIPMLPISSTAVF